MSPALRPRALLTEAEALALPANELDPPHPLRCAAAECAAPAQAGSARAVMQEIHFTCERGHLNALGSSAWQEAA